MKHFSQVTSDCDDDILAAADILSSVPYWGVFNWQDSADLPNMREEG
jgi:hypothetical protein